MLATMTRGSWIGIFVSLIAAGRAISGCVGDEPLPSGALDSGAESGAGTGLGTACKSAKECASGQCVDGVCCASACDSVCESCNLPGKAGSCEAIPKGEDPQTECTPKPLADAGSPATDAEAGADGGTFVVPDGGVSGDDNQCAGACNGERACDYPGKKRTCGTVFCGNAATEGRASCDGEGHCLFGTTECKAYACPNGSAGCKETCTGESDCLPTHFCDALSSTCKAKLANGSACSSVAQCQSGYCADAVCCNDSCNGYPGAKCNVPTKVGQCTCDACPGKTCKLYYRDEDGDGYGDKNGTPGNSRAVPGCEEGPAPTGYVADHSDCFDGPVGIASQVHPKQTSYFEGAYVPPGGSASWDYDCSGTNDKETREVPGGTCRLCGTGKSISKGGLISPVCTQPACKDDEVAVLSCTLGSGGRLTALSCGGPRGPAFTAPIACGNSGTTVTCGQCSGAVLGPSTFGFGKAQRCR